MSDHSSLFLTEFLSSAEELLARLTGELETLRAHPADDHDLTPLLRGFHSLKGNSSFLPDCPMTPLAHLAEEAVEAARDGLVAPARLLDPLAAVLDCVGMRVEEYRRRGRAAPISAREQELAAVLCKLVTADGGRAGLSARYFFAGEDVTDSFALIHQAEYGGVDPVRLRALRDRIHDLAAASGASGHAELDREREPDARELMRWLAERAVRVPVKGGAPLLARSAAGGDPARGGIVPRHFTVEAGVVDEFLEHAVELRVFGDRLARIDQQLRELVTAPAGSLGAGAARSRLEPVAAEMHAANQAFAPLAARLQERLLAIRRMPVKRLLDRHAAMIRDLAPRLGKDVAVAIEGGSTRADKSIVEQLEPPLMHMVRNAVDHGLETPAARSAGKKPARGTVTLRASSEGQWFKLEVADDGAGIDTAALRRSAVERGFLDGTAAARLSDEQAMQLVFLPGLSSRREVDELSGRGVGMDEVFAAVRQLRGTIRIESTRGRGTSFVIKVPDTGFAVVRCVPVRVGRLRFLIPHDATRRWTESETDPQRDGPLIELADVAPHLGGEWLAGAAAAPAPGERGSGERGSAEGGSTERGSAEGGSTERGSGEHPLVVVLESGGRRFGLRVDEVGREVDVVVRPLDRELVRAPLWSMAALGEEGATRLVLDVDGLVALLPVAQARSLAPGLSDAA